MNLAGNQAKNLFKSIRTASRPPVVGMWTAATVLDQIRKRKRPARELLFRKKLKPGESYVIRVPAKGEGSLAEAVPEDTVVAEIGEREESIGSELLSTAAGLLSAAVQTESEEPETERSRRRRRDRGTAEGTGKRRRRRHRAAALEEPAPDAPSAPGSVMSTLVDVAASFSQAETGTATADEPAPKVSRRTARRQARLATLDEAELDREALPRRRRRKLRRAERRAQKRPSRRRTRKARRQQRKARAALNRVARKQAKLRRRERRVAAAEDEVAKHRARVEKRSTRRRHRKLRKAEKRLSKHLG
jgi:hypothetical protein